MTLSSKIANVSFFAVLCAIFCISACNAPFGPTDSAVNPNAGTPGPAQPGTAAPGFATPSATSTPAAGFQAWVQLSITYDGPAVTSPGPSPSPTIQPAAPGNLCDLPRFATIFRNGSYVAGPCMAQSTQTVPGNLDSNSTQQLIELVDPVISGGLSAPPVCTPDVQLGAMTVNLLLVDGSIATIIQYIPEQNGTCYLGGVTATKTLGLQLLNDLNQIYGQAFGAPPAPQP